MTTQFFLPGFEPAPCPDVLLHLPDRPLGMPLPPLFNYPRVSGSLRSIHAKCVGRAGECLLDSLLIRLGFESFAPGENLGFDRLIAVDVDGQRLVNLARVQIKAVTAAKSDSGVYSFEMAYGYRGNPQGRRRYHRNAFDIAALVILPKNAVFFTAEKRQSYVIHVSEVEHLQARPQESLLRALRQVWAERQKNNAALEAPAHGWAAS